MSIKNNHLGAEKSKYLIQHRNDLIDWWPWGPEVLQRAIDHNRPIFLSIGYPSNHGCHVMGQEVFSDQKISQYLNQNFINIKIDAEEYPDIDQYYQICSQIFSKKGGYPLNAFLLPNSRPMFVNAYIGEQGGDQFWGLINEIGDAFKNNLSFVVKNADKVVSIIENQFSDIDKLEQIEHFPSPTSIIKAVSEHADTKYGGFGNAPKFTTFPFYEWALEQMLDGAINKDDGMLIINSLTRMFFGAIYDHAKGGVYRYALDEAWQKPYFEKMLYDQAALLKVLVKLSLVYPSPLIFDNLIQTLDYLDSEMLSDDGCFFSAQDADSQEVEGLFYTFTAEEFEQAVNDFGNKELIDSLSEIKKWFMIVDEGNIHNKLNTIKLNFDLKDDLYQQKSWDKIRLTRQALLAARKVRIPPATNSQGVAGWNFLMLSALVDVIQYSTIDVIRERAQKILDKSCGPILKTFVRPGLVICHSTSLGFSLPLFEDYAFFAESQFRLYEITGDSNFLQNLEMVLDFIFKEFIDGANCLTRARSANDKVVYPNLPINPTDHSIRSPLGGLVQTVRRAHLLFPEKEYQAKLTLVMEQIKKIVLINPINAGESLRSLSYPTESFRLFKIPKKWLAKEQYVKAMIYFMPRTVFNYSENDSEEWEILRQGEKELAGSGIDEFIQIFEPMKD